MTKFGFKKLAAFSSLIPVGIGSVIGTIFLTNINKPVFEKIALLNIEESLPQEPEEEEIVPKIQSDKDREGGGSEEGEEDSPSGDSISVSTEEEKGSESPPAPPIPEKEGENKNLMMNLKLKEQKKRMDLPN